MFDNVIGFAPSWYEGQNNAGLGVYISPGSINSVDFPGEVLYVPAASTTYIWLVRSGQIQSGAALPFGIYPIAQVVSGTILTGTGVNIYNPSLTQAPGILSILDLRPRGNFSFLTLPVSLTTLSLSGWGSGAAIQNILTSSETAQFTILAGSSSSESPTITFIPPIGTWSSSPILLAQMTGGTGEISDVTYTSNYLSLILTYQGLPIVGQTYQFTLYSKG